MTDEELEAIRKRLTDSSPVSYAVFVRHAPTDIEALLAEVRRLQAMTLPVEKPTYTTLPFSAEEASELVAAIDSELLDCVSETCRKLNDEEDRSGGESR